MKSTLLLAHGVIISWHAVTRISTEGHRHWVDINMPNANENTMTKKHTALYFPIWPHAHDIILYKKRSYES